MAIGGAFLGGGVEVVPAGSCKLELEILTEDRANLTATFTIKGTSTYTVTAGADGRAVYTVPSGQTYTVSVNTTGYDNIASQTVVAESGTVRYVRFEAFKGRVKRSGDTMSDNLGIAKDGVCSLILKRTDVNKDQPTYKQLGTVRAEASNGMSSQIEFLRNTPLGHLASGVIISAYNSTGTQQSLSLYSFDEGIAQEAYVQHPSWRVGTNDNSDKSLTIKMANGLPSLVHTSGDETVAGEKTFLNYARFLARPIIKVSGNAMEIHHTGMDYSTSNSAESFIHFYDKSGTQTARIGVINGASKSVSINQKWNNVWYDLGIKFDGTNGFGYAPTTPTNATSTEIVTANWTIGKFVQKSGDTMTGTLKFDKRGIQIDYDTTDGTPIQINNTKNGNMSIGFSTNGLRTSLIRSNESDTNKVISLFVFGSEGGFSNYGALTCNYIKATNEFYANAPSFRIGTNDNSNKILTIAMANKLPSLVHTSDDEMIQGVKSFSNPVITTQYTGFHVKSANLTKGNGANSFNVNMYMGFHDKNDTGVNLSYNLGGLRYTVPVGTSENPANVFVELSNQYYRDTYLRLYDDGKKRYATAPTTPTNAILNEIATANWVNNKVGAKNKVTNVTSYAQLIELIRNGKRGDSFGLTMDYTGSAFGGITTSEAVAIHAFGHYTLEELTVTDGTLSSFQAFGSGEVSGKFIENDNTTYTHATTGFGRAAVLQGYADALRVVEDGELTYFLTDDENTTSFDGYYISI